MATVFITRPIPEKGIALLRDAGHAVVVRNEDSVIPREELLRSVKGVDALLAILTDKIDAEVLSAAEPQLKIVANYAVGVDNIDLGAAKERGVMVANAAVPAVAEAVAEHAFALVLALAKRIVEADKFTREGKYKGWGPMLLLGTDAYGKTLGIVGAGRIGVAVARRAVKGFGMKLLYTDPKPNKELEKEFGAQYVPTLEDMLPQCDFVSIHVPLFPATRHLFNEARLRLMKKTAFLINTSRGPIVEEKALLKALSEKWIAGAALDVFECEPSIDCDIADHLALTQFPNVILTPHTASATIETRTAMSVAAAENIIAALKSDTPPNLVK